MKTFRVIGIDPIQYEEIKYTTFIDWVMKHTKTAKECQACFQEKALQKYFMTQLSRIEINFVAHLQMFKKPLTDEEKLDLYFDYLERFDIHFPHALKPRVKRSNEEIKYEYN